jgi:hypothetical protein
MRLLVTALTSAFLLGEAATSPQFVLDASDDAANHHRFATIHSDAGQSTIDVCGVKIPLYDQKEVDWQNSVRNPDLSISDTVRQVKPLPTAASKFSLKEHRLMEPTLQFEEVPSLNTFKKPLKDDEKMKKVAALTKEHVIARLVADSSLPESPLEVEIGAVKQVSGDPALTGFFRESKVAEKLPVEKLLNQGLNPTTAVDFANADNVRARYFMLAFQNYTNKVSFLGDDATLIQPFLAPDGRWNELYKSPEIHKKSMARTTDALLVAVRQALEAVEHLRELRVSHGAILGSTTSFDAEAGTVRLEKWTAAALGLDHFRDPAIEKSANIDGAIAIVLPVPLPSSFKDHNWKCEVPNAAPGTTLQSLLLFQHDSLGGAGSRWKSPLRLVMKDGSLWDDNLKKQLLGVAGSAELAEEEKKYSGKPGYGAKIATPAIQYHQDLWSIGMLALDLLTGSSWGVIKLVQIPCTDPGLVGGEMQYSKDEESCKALKGGIWNEQRFFYAMANWLDAGDKAESAAAFGATNADDAVDAGGKPGDNAAEAAAKRAAELEDVRRRRLFSLLHGLSRHVSAAQRARYKKWREQQQPNKQNAAAAALRGNGGSGGSPLEQYINHYDAMYLDSPLGLLWSSTPVASTKWEIALPPKLTITNTKTGTKREVSMADFPSKSKEIPLFPYIDLSVVTSLHGKSSFEVTEEELLASAEGSPYAKGLDFDAKPATRSILDLIKGLLTLRPSLQIQPSEAISLIDTARLNLLAELGINDPKSQSDLENHLHCLSACTSAVSAYRTAADPAKDVTAATHCKTLKGAPSAAHCEQVHASLLAYGADGVGFTTLVKPSYGITLASFQSLCRAKICGKKAPADVPKQVQQPSSAQALEEESKQEVEEVKAAVQDYQPVNDPALQKSPSLAASLVRLEALDHSSSVLLPVEDVNPNQRPPGILKDAGAGPGAAGSPGSPADKQQQQKKGVTFANANAVATYEGHKPASSQLSPAGSVPMKTGNDPYTVLSTAVVAARRVRLGFERYITLAKENLNAKIETQGFWRGVVRKGPHKGGFWGTWNFDSYSKNRILEVTLLRDERDKSDAYVIPALRWLDAADKARRELLSPKWFVPVPEQFGKPLEERGSAPLYLTNDPDLLGPIPCDKLKELVDAKRSKAFPLPTVRDCGNYPEEYLYMMEERRQMQSLQAQQQGNTLKKEKKLDAGVCMCQLTGKASDPWTADSVLRAFFYKKKEAKIFEAVAKELLATAMEHPMVRKPGAAAGGGGSKKGK